MSTVLLGYELRTGKPIEIPVGHLAITGQSQASGKTTTLEGLVDRCGLRAVAFVTKRGEGSFRVGEPIPPYFHDRVDWLFLKSILEATASEKLKFQVAEIINLCQNYSGPEGSWKAPKTLADVMANAETALKKARGIPARVYTELFRYLSDVVPEIERLPYSKKLKLEAGLNVMDLTDYSFPLQSLVVRSVIEWVHHHATKTIIVIPEAWHFAPKKKGSPVKMAAEELVRQGAALRNFLWCDSQDLAGVSSVLLRQVTVWLFGVQRDPGEIERTLDYLPADAQKPTRRDIATLGKGEFIVSFAREMYRVYVQPAWMSGVHAEAIARGEESIDSALEIVRDFDLEREAEQALTREEKLLIVHAMELVDPDHNMPKREVIKATERLLEKWDADPKLKAKILAEDPELAKGEQDGPTN
jgi:hypothetical protein